MEKRYQVFVSSTYEDLREERQQVMLALLELDCIPSGMELFPAASEDQWTLIRSVIDDCDYYLVIIAGRYGSIGADGKSYTQMEYEYAISKQKPTIAFLHETPGNILTHKTESRAEGKEKLETFRRLAETKICKYWSSPSDLGSKISRSIVHLIKNHPAPGWVRAGEVAEGIVAQEILRLRNKIEELRGQLDSAQQLPPQGTEVLSQGEDIFKLEFAVTFVEDWTHVYWIETSWNDIFRFIAPQMIDKATEGHIRRTIETSFWNELQRIANEDEEFKEQGDGTVASRLTLSTASLMEEDFKTIIIQLRALGLIARDQRQRSIRDSKTYWALTPRGDQLMTRLRAIRKGEIKLSKPEPITVVSVEG